MLTATQVETVAFVTDGGIICRDCAESRFGELGVAAIEEGIAEFLPQDVSPLIRYELDNLVGELAWDYAAQDVDENDPEADRIIERKADEIADEGYACDDCGRAIT